VQAVEPAKSVYAQVRMGGRRGAAGEPSAFIPAILKPVHSFFGAGGAGTRVPDLRADCARTAFTGACARYAAYVGLWRKQEESLRRLNRAQKSTFSLFGGGKPAAGDRARDDERVRTQMIVDVNAVGQDAGTLGVDVESCEAFVALRDLVHTALVEGRSLSLFLLDHGLLDVQKRQQHEEELGGKWLPFFLSYCLSLRPIATPAVYLKFRILKPHDVNTHACLCCPPLRQAPTDAPHVTWRCSAPDLFLLTLQYISLSIRSHDSRSRVSVVLTLAVHRCSSVLACVNVVDPQTSLRTLRSGPALRSSLPHSRA
jgi:hypothetical protein